MRGRIIVTAVAVVAALVGCTQDDQELPFDLQDEKPVTRAVPASGDMTISTPAGLSVTIPEGALPAGSRVTVARLEPQTVLGGPQPIDGAVYVIGSDQPLGKDPVVNVSATLGGSYTAGELVGLVPVVFRLDTDGSAPLASIAPSSRAYAPAAETGMTNEEKFDALVEAGIFDGLDTDAPLQGTDLDRESLAQIMLKLLNLEEDPAVVEPDPPFADFANPWWSDPITFMQPTGAMGSWGANDSPFGVQQSVLDRMSQALGIDGQEWEAFLSQQQQSAADWANAYIAYLTSPSFLALRQNYGWEGSTGGETHALIPAGQTSETFSLVCTGIEWDETIQVCGNGNIDVRASATLRERFPVGLLAVNYFGARATLNADGTATGRIEYDVALRTVLASGIAGYPLADSLDLSGTWSVDGNTITIGGRDFRFSTPDAESLILMVDDSIRIENNDGTESWEPVQAHVKLIRQ